MHGSGRRLGSSVAIFVLLAPLGASPSAAAPPTAPPDVRQGLLDIEQEIVALAAANPSLFANPPPMPWRERNETSPLLAFDEARLALADLRVRAALRIPDGSAVAGLPREEALAWMRAFGQEIQGNASALVAAARAPPYVAPPGPWLEDVLFRQIPAFAAIVQASSIPRIVAIAGAQNGSLDLSLFLPTLVGIESERVAWQHLNTTIPPWKAFRVDQTLTVDRVFAIRANSTYASAKRASVLAREADSLAVAELIDREAFAALAYVLAGERIFAQERVGSVSQPVDARAMLAAEEARVGGNASLLSTAAQETSGWLLDAGTQPQSRWAGALGQYAALRLVRGLPALDPQDFLPANATASSPSPSPMPPTGSATTAASGPGPHLLVAALMAVGVAFARRTRRGPTP